MSNDIETELLNAINEGNYNKVNSMLIVNRIHATEIIDGKPFANPCYYSGLKLILFTYYV